MAARLVKLEESATDARAGDVLAGRVLEVDLRLGRLRRGGGDRDRGAHDARGHDTLLAMREHARAAESVVWIKTGEKGSVSGGRRGRGVAGEASERGRDTHPTPRASATRAERASGWERVDSAWLDRAAGDARELRECRATRRSGRTARPVCGSKRLIGSVDQFAFGRSARRRRPKGGKRARPSVRAGRAVRGRTRGRNFAKRRRARASEDSQHRREQSTARVRSRICRAHARVEVLVDSRRRIASRAVPISPARCGPACRRRRSPWP